MAPSKNTKVKTKTTKENTMSSPTTDRPDLSKQLVTNNQIADMLGCAPASLTQYKGRDESFPKPAFISGKVMVFWRDEAEAWAKNKLKQRKSKAADLEARAQAMLETAKRLRNK